MLRAKFRFLDDTQRLAGKKKERNFFFTVHISPLDILAFWDVSFLISRIGIVRSDSYLSWECLGV